MGTKMLESLTGDDIYAAIVMLTSVPNRRAILCVESGADADCFAPHVNEDGVRFVPCNGKRNLMRAIELADAADIKGVLGIRDRDWIGTLEDEPVSRNLVLTDIYDLDATLILRTDIGKRTLIVFGSHDIVGQYIEKVGAHSAVDILVHITSALGRLRLVSERHSLRLSLERFPVGQVVDISSGEIRPDEMIALARRRSPECTKTEEEIRELFDSEPTAQEELLCSGHDLGATMAFLIQAAWGGARPAKDVILKTVRSALACSELRSLRLFDAVVAWERNSDWMIWSCPTTAA